VDTAILVRDCDINIAPYLESDGYWESSITLACRRLVQPGC
jgi:hypothetical protein